MLSGFDPRKKAAFFPLSTFLTGLFFILVASLPAAGSGGDPSRTLRMTVPGHQRAVPEIRMTKAELQKVLRERAAWKQKQMAWYAGGLQGPEPGVPEDGLFLESVTKDNEANQALYEFNNAILTVGQVLVSGPHFNVDGKLWDGKIIPRIMKRLIDTQGIFITHQKIYLDGVQKDLVNDPESGTILMYLPAWRQASFAQKQLLAVHEVLGLAGIPDENYQVSSQWMAQYDELTQIEVPSILKDFEQPEYILSAFFEGGKYSNDPVPGFPEAMASVETRTADGEVVTPRRDCLRRFGAQPYVWLDAKMVKEKGELKRIYVNWVARCRLSATETWSIGPVADGEKDPEGWYEVRGHRILKKGIQIGWISGMEFYLRTSHGVLQAELQPRQPPPVPGFGDGSWGAFRIVRRGMKAVEIFRGEVRGLGDMGILPLDHSSNYEEMKP